MTMIRLLVLMAAIVIAMPGGVIFYEDFEGGVNVQSQTSGALEGTLFRVVSGSVDVVTPADSYTGLCAGPTLGTCVDMTGGGRGGLGTIETIATIDLDPGEYFLSFDLLGWFFPTNNHSQSSTILVTFGDLFSEEFIRVGSNNPYDTVVRSIFVDEAVSLRLVFQTTAGSAFAGTILDNVILRSVVPETPEDTTATPEPGSLLLVALGGMVVFLGRKRLLNKSA